MRSGNMTHQRYPPHAVLPLDTVSHMPPADVTSRTFSELTTTELHDILRLRGDVFVVEQQCVYTDIDGRDAEPATRHHWISAEATIAVYARTLSEPEGATRIGRVVTAPGSRGAGLAARLVNHITDTTSGPIELDAQSHLVDWYHRLGFTVVGPEFVEDGIPHVPMQFQHTG